MGHTCRWQWMILKSDKLTLNWIIVWHWLSNRDEILIRGVIYSKKIAFVCKCFCSQDRKRSRNFLGELPKNSHLPWRDGEVGKISQALFIFCDCVEQKVYRGHYSPGSFIKSQTHNIIKIDLKSHLTFTLVCLVFHCWWKASKYEVASV